MGQAPPAPLGRDFSPSVLWHFGVEVPLASAGDPPREADVVVVGAGYAGVRAATGLAARGKQVVVLEADDLGTGASTRNGGMVIPELKSGPRALARRYGPLGRELVDSVFSAFNLVENLIAENNIDCDYHRFGGLLLAHHRSQVAHLQEEVSEWRDDLGEEAQFLSRSELSTEIGSDKYFGGLLVSRTGGLQPAKYHAALVDLALKAGAQIFDRKRVTSIAQDSRGGYQVKAGSTVIRADEVFLATNAYADAIAPELAKRVLPMGSFIIATEVLDPELAASCIPNGRMVYDTKNFLFYWRISPDGRMVFGGRTSLATTTVAEAQDVLYQKLLSVHPQLVSTNLEYAWGGNVAITFDRLPHCGRTPIPGGGSVAFATGCNGTGVALATWFGDQAASWLSGEIAPPPFSQLPFPKVPLVSLRNWYLPVVGQYFHWRDQIGR